MEEEKEEEKVIVRSAPDGSDKKTFCCRYIAHAGKCHYIVDLENSAVTDFQPRYADSSNWTVQAGLKDIILNRIWFCWMRNAISDMVNI